MMILYAIAMGVSIGVMALVARRIGEQDADTAGRTAAQSTTWRSSRRNGSKAGALARPGTGGTAP